MRCCGRRHRLYNKFCTAAANASLKKLANDRYLEPIMTGTLITTCKDAATGLNYCIYLIRYKKKLCIATYDIDHTMLVQVQEVCLAEEKVPENIRSAVQEWLL